MHKVLVGTSGWNDPGGTGTWNGVFYPRAEVTRFAERAKRLSASGEFIERYPELGAIVTPPGLPL